MLLTSLLLLAASPPASTDLPSLAEVRVAARQALGLPGEAGAVTRAGTSRLFGETVPWKTSVDADGRFVTSFGGELPRRIGFDGEAVWMRHADGAVRALALGERVDELLAAWVLSGYWAAEGCPIECQEPVRNEKDPEDGLLHIRFQLEDAASGLDEPARGVLRVRHDDFVLTEALWKRSGHVRGIGLQAGTPAAEASELSYSAKLGELSEPLVLAREARPAEPTEGIFERPPSSGARFDPEVPAALQVVRTPTGHLLVEAAVDGQGGWFFLDTGAGMSMLDRDFVQSLEPRVLGQVGVGGVGGEVTSAIARFEVLELGPMTVDRPVFVTIDLAGVRAALGHEVVGLLGFDVFARSAVTFAVAKEAIALHDPASFEPAAGMRWEPLLLFERHPAVRAVVEGHDALLRVDTGASDMLDLEGPAIEAWNLLEGRETTASRSGGIGGEIETLSGVLESLVLGGYRFEEVSAGFVQTTSGFHGSGTLDGNLGLQALEPFAVTFDYERSRIGFLPLGQQGG